MMREFVMAFFDVDDWICFVAALVREHVRADARDVGLKCQHQHVAHQFQVFFVTFGYRGGLGILGNFDRRQFGRPVHASFDVANR